MNVFILEGARLDIDRAVKWYLQNGGRKIASRFVEELDSSLLLLGAFPAIGEPVAQSTRKKTMESFPYCLVYRIENHRIYLKAVAHQARRPGYWDDKNG